MLYTVTKVTNLETVKIEFRHLRFLLRSDYFYGTVKIIRLLFLRYSYYTSARVQNYYKGLFVALTGQQFPVVQWLGMVACIADVRVRFSLQSYFFFFFKELKFFFS